MKAIMLAGVTFMMISGALLALDYDGAAILGAIIAFVLFMNALFLPRVL